MATAKTARSAYLQVRDRFLELDNVIGVGFGSQEIHGKLTGELAIVVLTADSDPGNQPDVPRAIGDVPVVVRPARLTQEEHLAFLERNGIPPEQGECNIDHFFLSDRKIHQRNLERLRRGKGDDRRRLARPAPGDAPADLFAEVHGEIFVIQDDGTLITDGTIDHVAVYNVFRATFGDHYDFVLFAYDTASGVPNLGNSSPTVHNQITGINHYVGDSYDERATWNSTRLQSYQKIPNLTQVRRVLHETAHRWCSYVYHREGGAHSNNLHAAFTDPVQAAYHWSSWMDDDDSCMDYDYFDWLDSASVPGEFEKNDLTFGAPGTDEYGFHPLDLYLMGLMSPDEVGSFRYIDAPTDPDGDGSFAGTEVTLTVANITDEEGPRNPAYPDTQRVFHQAYILLTNNLAGIGDLADPATVLGNVELYRKGFLDAFRRKTLSRATIDCSLLHANFESIHIRDNDADSGGTSSTGPFWNSPDIWVRRNDDGLETHESPIRGQDNFVHARIHNSSGTDYDDVTVRIYRANFAGTEFYFPDDWYPDQLIGEAIIDVPAGGTATAKVVWRADFIPDATWHPCLLVELVPMEVIPELRHHVWDNRKLAQKNITIVDPPGDRALFDMDFAFGHPTRAREKFAWLTIARTVDVPGLDLYLDAGGLKLEVERDPRMLPDRLYLPRSGSDGSAPGASPWRPWRWVLQILHRLLALLFGHGRDRSGVIVPVQRGGRTVYRLPGDALIGLRVPGGAAGRVKMALHGDLSNSPPSARGLIQVTQSDDRARVVGGFDIQIRG